MPTPQLSEAVKIEIAKMCAVGHSAAEIKSVLRVSDGSVAKFRNYTPTNTPPAQQESKKVGEFDLDEWLDWMEDGQKLKKKHVGNLLTRSQIARNPVKRPGV